MDLEKIFNDLESNQNHECEEAKKKLSEQFTLTKDQWLVHSMMEYYLKTGSSRIIEVLVKAQYPHDGYLFDRLADWLKTPLQRVHSLTLFCFVIRRHPTWLFKVEKHRLIKDMLHWLKQLEIEKEIVPLMSALLAIITLLPIIPNLVPNFLNDLFAVFAHLASWNNQHTARLSEDKLVHLQLGLQMLFHRLYGMFPCNFVAFLTEFIRKEKGAIFQHTIKPLLETVRLHPMLVTANVETEINSERWKDIQPHDVVVECMSLSLPMKYQDISNFDTGGGISNTRSNVILATTGSSTTTTTTFYQLTSTSTLSRPHCRELQQQRLTGCLHGSNSGIWSPYHEIINASHTPLTPTPTPYMMPLSSSSAAMPHNQANLGVTDCSPPEAAVEATPETTPLKDNRDVKRPTLISGTSVVANPLAVRDIFASSQPSSPHRGKDSLHLHNYQQQQHFNFPDVTSSMEQEVTSRFVNRVNTNYDRKLQQILQDRRQTQSPFQTIDPLPKTPSDFCRTPDVELTSSYATIGNVRHPYSNSITPLSVLTATSTPTPPPFATPLPMHTMSTPVEIPITKVCDQCNETDQTICTEGGLQMPTSRSMQLLAKGLKRRNRMASYCYNEKSCERVGIYGNNCSSESLCITHHKIRRTKSLSSLYLVSSKASQTSGENSDSNEEDSGTKSNERPLQKCPKMLAIASVIKNSSLSKSLMEDKTTQTLEAVPQPNHEHSLLQMLIESKDCRAVYESRRQTPNEILEQFIVRGLRNNGIDRFDQEQFQLLCLQLQYERYRREIHAERNRRLMGRSRDKRSLEMERDRLKEQLKDFEMKNKELSLQLDKTKKATNERECEYQEELEALKEKYQNELEQNRCLRQTNVNLETKLKEELSQRKDINYELEALRGQVFSLTTELQHAQQQADIGSQCRQELSRLEADFIVMGEVQIKCRDKLAEMENYRARDEELTVLQETFNIELKDVKHNLDDKSSQLEGARHKIQELQSQLLNNDKVITDQKRLLKAVKDEYEEKFKSLNRKYEIQKTIIMQMEEKFMMSLHKPLVAAQGSACYSPDTDKTDIASSVERNSPLSTSLASSESLSTSLKSSELRNLQQLVENPITEASISSNNGTTTIAAGGINITDSQGQYVTPQTLDLASSANTATNMLNLKTEQNELSSPSAGATMRLPTIATMKSLASSSNSTTHTISMVSNSNNPTTTHMHQSLQQSSSKFYHPATE